MVNVAKKYKCLRYENLEKICERFVKDMIFKLPVLNCHAKTCVWARTDTIASKCSHKRSSIANAGCVLCVFPARKMFVKAKQHELILLRTMTEHPSAVL
jgi:hypothetical protein